MSRSADCSELHPVLCTNSAPAYNVNNTTPAAGSQVTLQAGNLTVTAFRDARSFRALGMPFATPPTGNLRFRPAQPYTGYTNINATLFQNSCIQYGGFYISEDCLTLNIFSPYIPAQNSSVGLRPVAVWYYGGSFTSGSASMPAYDGGNMASRGDVVVVTVNYRLGALGNLATSDGDFSGSQGITDQIQALRWIRQYISHFGGDPTRVTIFGESAGAQSVIAIMSSSSAKGLFAAAIEQSAPIGIPWPDRRVYSDYITPAIGAALNCTNVIDETALKTCLRQADSRAFVSLDATAAIAASAGTALGMYSGATQATSRVEPIAPILNPEIGVLDDQILSLIGSGSLPSGNIPVLFGNNRDEASLFISAALPAGLPSTQDVFNYVVGQAYGNATTAAVTANPSLFPVNTTDPTGTADAVGQLSTLFAWQCPLNQILIAASNQSTFSKIYSYRLDMGVSGFDGLQVPACSPGAANGVDLVCHAEDISEVFGNSNVRGFAYNQNGTSYNDLGFNQYVIDQWTSFMRTYDPNPTEAYLLARGRGYTQTLAYRRNVTWPEFTSTGATPIHQLDSTPANIAIPYTSACAVLQSNLLYNTINSTFANSQ